MKILISNQPLKEHDQERIITLSRRRALSPAIRMGLRSGRPRGRDADCRHNELSGHDNGGDCATFFLLMAYCGEQGVLDLSGRDLTYNSDLESSTNYQLGRCLSATDLCLV